jgi:anti-anti-sigma regulatory factor
MVFSFFKKPPEKMVAKPAAVFRPEERGVAAPESPDAVRLSKSTVAPDDKAAADACSQTQESDQALDFTDFDFDHRLRDMQVEAEVDPIDADVEQAVILYADAHDDAARSILEDAVRVHRYGPGERLWLMLFDLYLLTGQKTAFEALASDYAQCFGQCSPGWRDSPRKTAVTKAVASVLFKGDLSGDNDAAFNAVRKAMETNIGLRLDLSKVEKLDAAGCGRLLGFIHKARKARREIELLGVDKLREKLEACVKPGTAEGGDYWLMLLEIYQSQGLQERFEDLAIDYAVTFEISPPSWEEKRVAPRTSATEPAPKAEAVADERSTPDAYWAQGDIRATRFADLAAFVEVHDPVLIDCSGLARIDFVSAGALLNVLSSAKRSGKHIVFRHPNHLVAELFAVVGLKAIADIIPANI